MIEFEVLPAAGVTLPGAAVAGELVNQVITDLAALPRCDRREQPPG